MSGNSHDLPVRKIGCPADAATVVAGRAAVGEVGETLVDAVVATRGADGRDLVDR